MENSKRRGMYEEEFDELDDVSNQIQKQAIKARRMAAGNETVPDVEMVPVEPEEAKDVEEEDPGTEELPESDSETEPELMMIDNDVDEGFDFEVASVKSFNSDRSKVQIMDPVYALGPQTSASAQMENAKSDEKKDDQEPQASTSNAGKMSTFSAGRAPAMLEGSKYMARIKELHPNRVFDIRPQSTARGIAQVNGWVYGARGPGASFNIRPQMNGIAVGLPPAVNNEIRAKLKERAMGLRPDPAVIGGNIRPQPNGNLVVARPDPNNEIRPDINGMQPVPQLSPRATPNNAAPLQGVQLLPHSTDDEDSDSDCSGRHNTGDDAEVGRARQYAELLELRRFTPPPYHNFEFENGSDNNFGRPLFGNAMDTFLVILTLFGFVGAALFLVIFLKKILPKV